MVQRLQGPHFINVDLEVWSRTELTALAAALEPRAVILHAGKLRRRFLVCAEARVKATSPERTIRALLDLIGSLSPSARRSWNRAQSRVFNIGYEGCGFVVPVVERPVGSGCWYARDPDSPTHCETSLSPALLQAVARVGGTVTTTIYPATKQVRPRAP